MANSLMTGISGLKSHQKMLEVAGNNLANMNTTAFKASRTLFADLMYETARGASSASNGNLGGINPIQFGTGSRVAAVDRDFRNGNLEATGQAFDFAIDGAGYFVAANSAGTLYTRAGAFGLDDAGYLVDPSTGNFLQRFGSVGESNGVSAGYQTPGDDRIFVPIGAALPGEISTEIGLVGNLSATATGPIAQALSLAEALTTGGGSPATGGTLLNDLDSNTVDYDADDELRISGKDHDGSDPAVTSFAVNAGTTVQDLIDTLNTAFPLSTFSLDANGRITAEADATGPSQLQVTVRDATQIENTSQTGATSFSAFERSAYGKDADVTRSTVEVYDSMGAGHQLDLEWTKQSDGTWDMTVTADPNVGIVSDGLVEGITFRPDGTFSNISGTGIGDAGITIQFTGQSAQTMHLNPGEPGSLTGLVQQRPEYDLRVQADGYAAGEVETVDLDSDGILYGIGSNGVNVEIAQVAVAFFRNDDGLVSVGDNYYQASLSSGSPEISTGQSGARGALRNGQLESSNVDLALEFTRLIVAQRGFSANARTITVTDEILQELNSLIR